MFVFSELDSKNNKTQHKAFKMNFRSVELLRVSHNKNVRRSQWVTRCTEGDRFYVISHLLHNPTNDQNFNIKLADWLGIFRNRESWLSLLSRHSSNSRARHLFACIQFQLGFWFFQEVNEKKYLMNLHSKAESTNWSWELTS